MKQSTSNLILIHSNFSTFIKLQSFRERQIECYIDKIINYYQHSFKDPSLAMMKAAAATTTTTSIIYHL
jgi:hypothetical protein